MIWSREIAIFSRDVDTGSLSYVGLFRPENSGEYSDERFNYLSFSADGRHIYAVSNANLHQPDAIGWVYVLDRNAETGELTLIETHENGVNGVDGLECPAGIAISPEGSHIYTISRTDNTLNVFERNLSTGTLSYVRAYRNGEPTEVVGLAGAISVAISPDGENVYVAGILEHVMVVFQRDKVTGDLTFVETRDLATDGILDPAWLNHVTVSGDGRHVYATAQGILIPPYDGDESVLIVYARDKQTGTLTPAQWEKNGENGLLTLKLAKSVAVSPDNNHVYAVGWAANAVNVFSSLIFPGFMLSA